MSRTFKFGFGDDEDLEKDEYSGDDECQGIMNSDAVKELPAGAVLVLHSLDDLLNSLPSKIEYNTITIQSPDHGNITLARRELFDIRAQLMAEDNALDDSYTAGLSMDDIKPNIYEGGFKTWESSVDLAKYVATQSKHLSQITTSSCTIIELGAGSALPTLFLFRFLFSKTLAAQPPHTTMVLADFNFSVLKLATIPNLLLNWSLSKTLTAPESGGVFEFLDDSGADFQGFLSKANIEIQPISGSWGPDLSTIALPESSEASNHVLILASETIYSPSSTRAFTETLLDLLRRSEKNGGRATALVAAKRVYFGVGGGVDEFLVVLRELGGQGTVVWTTEGLGSGVRRCILEVTNDDRKNK
ncbi:MAG: hypothetical protein Q9213_000241 [Squamulea squamosa]